MEDFFVVPTLTFDVETFDNDDDEVASTTPDLDVLPNGVGAFDDIGGYAFKLNEIGDNISLFSIFFFSLKGVGACDDTGGYEDEYLILELCLRGEHFEN